MREGYTHQRNILFTGMQTKISSHAQKKKDACIHNVCSDFLHDTYTNHIIHDIKKQIFSLIIFSFCMYKKTCFFYSLKESHLHISPGKYSQKKMV